MEGFLVEGGLHGFLDEAHLYDARIKMKVTISETSLSSEGRRLLEFLPVISIRQKELVAVGTLEDRPDSSSTAPSFDSGSHSI